MKANLRNYFLSKKHLSTKILKQPSPESHINFKENKTFLNFYPKKNYFDILNDSIKNTNALGKNDIKKSNYGLNKKYNHQIYKSFKKIQKSKTIMNPKTKNKFTKNRRILKFNINPVKNRTVFQQIIEDISKMKIKTNKTLDIIKKNVKISNKEASKRSTEYISIDKLIKAYKAKKKTNSDNNLFLSKNNDSFKSYNNKNYDFRPNSSSNNYLLDETNEKDFNNNSKSKENNALLGNQNLNLGHKSKHHLKFIKIPSISLNSIKEKDKGYDVNDKMFHFRNLNLSEEVLENKFERLYNNNNLLGKIIYIKEKELQLNDIFNKINLVLENIDYFKSNYMHKGIFYSAFDNMENKQKALFNLVLEEICVLLIKLVPKLLKNFYDNLDKLLYVSNPNIYLEMEKEPWNEKECLNYNYLFLNIVSFYFLACVDILKEIRKRVEYFKYNSSEYIIINNYLDLARYDSCKINSMAKIHISKTIKDKEILERFEIGLGIKEKKNNDNEDMLERYRKRQQQKMLEDTLKIDRINSALNFKAKSFSAKKLDGKKDQNKYNFEKRDLKSLLNSPLVINMMKYFKNNIKSQIISQQVIERYKIKDQSGQESSILFKKK